MVCAVLSLASCDFIARTFSSSVTSAHAEYAEGLADAGLAATPAARSWIEAADRALDEAEEVTLPAQRDGWFDVDSAGAVAVRFPAPDGLWVTVRARIAAEADARLFVDAFRIPADTAASPVVVASTGEPLETVSFRVRGAEPIVVRIQPELLRGGSWELHITASDVEPVDGEVVTMGRQR